MYRFITCTFWQYAIEMSFLYVKLYVVTGDTCHRSTMALRFPQSQIHGTDLRQKNPLLNIGHCQIHHYLTGILFWEEKRNANALGHPRLTSQTLWPVLVKLDALRITSLRCTKRRWRAGISTEETV